ncbi:30S ribosomal protein S6 [Candidatus Parcubacteria bacterium]|nr:MAG: 30S ribosomal protein S6 [Candidatus Parcubacteria bacterium]
MNYELSFIIGPNVPETEHKAIEQEILDNLKKMKANISKAPYAIGRKKLAYPIKKQKHGFYVFLEFELEEKTGLKDFEVKLKHDANILRHLIVKKDKVSEEEAKQKQASRAKSATVKKVEESKKEESSSAPEKEEKKEEVKVDLGDIDQQLDQILDKDL